MTSTSQAVTWFVSAILIEAAVIDGLKLRVPNWLTYNFAVGGLAFAAWSGGLAGLLAATAGAAVGLVLLLPLYAIGGMGAGDVKLLAGVGAWMGVTVTLWAFAATVVVGAGMALVMMARSGDWAWHWGMFHRIGHEILIVRDPVRLSAIAAARKSTMTLLPYGIPIAIGSIGYFVHSGLLF